MPSTILIVDDEPSIAEAVGYALTTDGMHVVVTHTLHDAKEVLAHQHVDLVVLDVGLPDGNGFELCRSIRRMSDIPIIFLTARSVEVDRIVGLELGADDYVAKPFSPRELSARVKAVLRRSPGRRMSESPPPVPSPSFLVDDHKHTILYFGRMLELSRYQFRILRMLLERPGWIYSRSQLMDHVWEAPDASFDRAVDTHIKLIRSKLRAVRPDIDPILTHRGEGYSVRDDL